jgi:Fe-Mn family superoxide dismutase
MQYTPKTFNIPTLKGISAKNIEEHVKLYNAYVKNTNVVLEKIEELQKDVEKNAYLLGELGRRFSFEYNGMRNHEIYFSTLEGGPKDTDPKSSLYEKIVKDFGSYDIWLQRFKLLAMTRGIGWAVLWHDKKEDKLINAWVDEQHLGQLSECVPILTIDMWEHAFVSDYQPSGKKQYVEDFMTNVNWSFVENRLSQA